jgi:deoxyribonuclease-4
MYIGAHVSIAGGIFNAPLNAAKIGAEVFQIFTRSPHGGPVPPLTDENVAMFKKNCELAGIPEWYVHTPYYINFGSSNNRVKYGSISALQEELARSSKIGAKYMMTHLGSYSDLGPEKGFEQLVGGLDKVLVQYEGTTQFLIEISAGAGNSIGGSFEELAKIVHHEKLRKYDIGICLDTQHTFAAGYDLRTPEAVEETLKKFDNTVGLPNLKMFHCNDSKVEFGAKMDRHQHIGEGYIGISGFESLFSNKKLQKINFALETEPDKIADDIKTLKIIRNKII